MGEKLSVEKHVDYGDHLKEIKHFLQSMYTELNNRYPASNIKDINRALNKTLMGVGDLKAFMEEKLLKENSSDAIDLTKIYYGEM